MKHSNIAAGILALAADCSLNGMPAQLPRDFDLYFTVPPAVADSVESVGETFMQRLLATGLFTRRTCMVFVSHDTIQARVFGNNRPIADIVNILGTRGQVRIYASNDSMYNVHTDSTWAPNGYLPLQDYSDAWHYVRTKPVSADLTAVDMRIEKFDEYMIYGELTLNPGERREVSLPKGAFLVATIDKVIYATTLLLQPATDVVNIVLVRGVPATSTFVLDVAMRYPLSVPVNFLGWKELKNTAHWQ